MTEAIENRPELTKAQIAFLEECNLEFSERYTDADLEYMKIYELGIPSPPIVYPWRVHTGGRRFNRDRPGGSRYNDHRNRNNDSRDDRQGSPSWYRGRRNFDRGDWNRHNERDGRRNQEQEDNVTRQSAQRPQHYRPY